MKIIKLEGLFIVILLLQACISPQSQSTYSSKVDAAAKLDGTIWCGMLQTKPASCPERFMAVYFLGGKAGLARGTTKEEAVSEVKKLVLNAQYQSSGDRVSILYFWDDGFKRKGGLGRVNAEVVFTNSNNAQIRMFHSTDPDASLIYEVNDACRYY